VHAQQLQKKAGGKNEAHSYSYVLPEDDVNLKKEKQKER
jgi:hypothetical protein